MSGQSHLPGLWPVPGEGVLARHGDLILLSSLESGQFVDTLLDLLDQIASSGGDGRRFADAVADAVEIHAMSSDSGVGDTAQSGPSVLAFGPAGSGLAVTVSGGAWAAVATPQGVQRIAAGQPGVLMRCLLRVPVSAVRGGLGSSEDVQAGTDRFSRLDGGTIRAGGLGFYPGSGGYPSGLADAGGQAARPDQFTAYPPAEPEPAVSPWLAGTGVEPAEPMSAAGPLRTDEAQIPDQPVPAEPGPVAEPWGMAAALVPDEPAPAREPWPTALAQVPVDAVPGEQVPAREPWPTALAQVPVEAVPGEQVPGPEQWPAPTAEPWPTAAVQLPDRPMSADQPPVLGDAVAGAESDVTLGPDEPIDAVGFPNSESGGGEPDVAARMPRREATELAPGVGNHAKEGPIVDGVYCENGHFDDPEAMFCPVCGVAMDRQAQVPRPGQRPPLGMLVLDDGSAFQLDSDYIVGREPSLDPSVASGAARPLRVADDAGIVSRVHARVGLDGWRVLLTDLGSANGTRVKAPGQSMEQELLPQVPVMLAAGTEIDLGGRGLRYESHRGQ